MKKWEQGFSLLELMVGVGLTIIVIYGFMTFVKNVSMKERKSLEKVYTKGDTRVLSEFVKKSISSGDLKFYGYTPKGERFRMLVALPGVCRNLKSHPLCEEDSSFLYTRYDKTTTPSITAICQFQSAGEQTLIIDLEDETFGEGDFSSSDSSIRVNGNSSLMQPSGIINLEKDALIALFSPPQAYIWQVTQKLAKYDITQKSDGSFSNSEFPEACKKSLQYEDDDKTTYKLKNLLFLKMIPFTLSQVVEGKGGADPNSMALGHQLYPLRIFNIRLETIGPSVDSKLNVKSLGISRCNLKNDQLKCDDSSQQIIPSIDFFRFDQKYKISLLEDNGNLIGRHKWYEILNNKMTPTCGKISNQSECFTRTLITNSLEDIPYLSTDMENKARLFGSSYSLLKQEEIEILRFRFKNQKANKKEEISVFLQ